MNRVKTLLSALFLAAIPVALVWYVASTALNCTTGTCNSWDAASASGLLGFGLLALVIWIGKRFR